MMKQTSMPADDPLAILSRVIHPQKSKLPEALARQILEWHFGPEDRQRIDLLLEKAKEGSLTPWENEEAENYERVGLFLSLLKAKARVSLKAKKTNGVAK